MAASLYRIGIRAALRSLDYFRHGAIVTKGGNILATGYNHDHTHAEVAALSKLWPSKRAGCTVWSLRVTNGGNLANGKPCPECLRYMLDAGVAKVVYSTADREIETMRRAEMESLAAPRRMTRKELEDLASVRYRAA